MIVLRELSGIGSAFCITVTKLECFDTKLVISNRRRLCSYIVKFKFPIVRQFSIANKVAECKTKFELFPLLSWQNAPYYMLKGKPSKLLHSKPRPLNRM